MRLIHFITLLLFCYGSLFSQSFYSKSFTPFLSNVEQGILPNDDILLAGNYDNNVQSIILSRLNPCGDTLWVKEIKALPYDLILTDLAIDTHQNVVLLINLMENGDRNTVVASIDEAGSLNFMKRFETTTADIAYSLDINTSNEILVYFKANIGQAGPHSENVLAKLDEQGQLMWMKQYGNTFVWGQMCSTENGGALISDYKTVVKVNSTGNVEWTKEFQTTGYAQDHFETPNGYLFFKYDIGANNYSFAIMLNKNGSLKWKSPILPNFRPRKGILRKNGNLLYVGDLVIGSISNHVTLVEMDSSNGNILQLINHEVQNPLTLLYDLDELDDSTISYTGNSSLSFTGETFLGRIPKSLHRTSCKDTLIDINNQQDPGGITNVSPWSAQNKSIVIINEAVQINAFTLTLNATNCLASKAIQLTLGPDTTLCPNATLRIGDKNNAFEGYFWSNGSNNSQINVNQVGTYWLKAWNGCDTISDTINVSYHSIPSLQLGNDTTLCPNSTLTLSTNNGEIANWSNGQTAATITVSSAGIYWGEIPSVCGPIRDSITIDYFPQLQATNLPSDTSLCPNESIFLTVDPNASFVLWSNGATSPSVILSKPGKYSVIYGHECDTLRDTVSLNIHQVLPLSAIVTPQKAQVLDSIFYTIHNENNYQQITWDFKDGSTSVSAQGFHFYKSVNHFELELYAIDTMGCKSDSLFELEITEASYVIPNVFTPNNDGINDVFEIRGKGIKNLSMEIFNRWGELVFQSTHAPWDGRSKEGKVVMNGTYFYKIQFEQTGSTKRIIEGSVQLLR